MTLQTKIHEALKLNPEARERRTKHKFLTKMLQDKYDDLKIIPLEVLEEAVRDYASMDRIYRKLLQDNPNLRGSDYEDKHELENEKLEELGYKQKILI